MKIKTNVKAGGRGRGNHNEAQVGDPGGPPRA